MARIVAELVWHRDRCQGKWACGVCLDLVGDLQDMMRADGLYLYDDDYDRRKIDIAKAVKRCPRRCYELIWNNNGADTVAGDMPLS